MSVKVFAWSFGNKKATRHRASTSTRWHFTFALYCHSNETRAPIANPPNSAQLRVPYHFPKLHPGPCSSVGMRWRTDRHTDRHIDARDQYTFRVVYDLREMYCIIANNANCCYSVIKTLYFGLVNFCGWTRQYTTLSARNIRRSVRHTTRSTFQHTFGLCRFYTPAAGSQITSSNKLG